MPETQTCHLEELDSLSVTVNSIDSIILNLQSLLLGAVRYGEFMALISYMLSIGPLKGSRIGKYLMKKRNVKKPTRTPLTLDLQPGEVVEVLPYEKILSTLDSSEKLQGLGFMPEMRKYCGKRFKVLKRVDKMMIEGKGMRRLRPAVLLDGVFCDGQAHGGCQRTCYCFWREGWLKRVDFSDRDNKPGVGVEPT